MAAAATSLGYQVAAGPNPQAAAQREQVPPAEVQLQIEQSELITDALGRDQQIRVTREGVTVTFSRDSRGRAALCVSGEGHSEAELRALGEELSQRVVQQYVYQRLLEEMRERQFLIVEEAVDENHAIRLKVRHWEN